MRTTMVTAPELPPVRAGFPDPEPPPGREPPKLVGAGMHHVVRGIGAVARTGDGRRIRTGFPSDSVGRHDRADGHPVRIGGGVGPASAEVSS